MKAKTTPLYRTKIFVLLWFFVLYVVNFSITLYGVTATLDLVFEKVTISMVVMVTIFLVAYDLVPITKTRKDKIPLDSDRERSDQRLMLDIWEFVALLNGLAFAWGCIILFQRWGVVIDKGGGEYLYLSAFCTAAALSLARFILIRSFLYPPRDTYREI